MIATTIKQSRHLLKLGLDPKSADLHWYDVENDNPHKNDWVLMCNYCTIGDYDKATYIPAWSLSALLEVMRKANAVTTLQVTSLSTLMRCKDMGFIWQNDLYINDPTTAAYEMVCYLLRNNLIEKGGQDETDKRTS